MIFIKLAKWMLENPYVWKSNLLGGGRLIELIRKISLFPVLEDYLLEKKEITIGLFGGFIVGNRKNKDEEKMVFYERHSIPTQSLMSLIR
jgi:hypothetical protein